MKRSTVFLSEMTNRELEEFLTGHSTILVPTGSTEQHGPHSPLGTDVIVPQELCRRAAPKLGAVVAPPLSYGLSYPHRGFAGEFSLEIDTFMAVVGDLCVGFARAGFRTIVFVNGHYDNTYGIAYGCARVAGMLPKGTRAFPLNYWDGLTPEQAGMFMGPDKGMHANEGEVSAVLAIDPELVDRDQMNTEFPTFPVYKASAGASHVAYFLTAPGSLYRITRTGTWGDATKATAEKGRLFLEWAEQALITLMEDVDNTYRQLPLR